MGKSASRRRKDNIFKSQKRSYRNLISKSNLVAFRVTVKETDLFVQASTPLEDITRELVLEKRGYIENYIKKHPEFARTLQPWHVTAFEPVIIRDMALAGEKAGVGPMAAVAGAIAEHVGIDLLRYSHEVVVENGGDVFLKSDDPLTVGIFAGRSPLSLRMGVRIESGGSPIAVCTSSGTVGHSLSLGKADAVCVVSDSCCLADAAATSIGNRVKSKGHIQPAVDFGKHIEGVRGIVVIIEDEIGIWGDLEVVPLNLEKG
ncbi:MAG: UPF0280 family protein [Desulfobacterales bacterium]|jgi:ApbE superfamily uncharacterized protein (UPF0280 family)